jgi:predicted phosphodiesterase
MRIALISDIHANLAALEQVLADVRRVAADQIICLGDVALGGPQPHEAVSRLRALHVPCVMGNHDERAFDHRPPEINSERDRTIDEINQWSRAQLSTEDIEFVRTRPRTILLPLANDGTLLGYHGSPRLNTDIVSATTDETELARMFAGYSATMFAGGHLHKQLLRSFRDALIINPGSVGLPWAYTSTTAHHNLQRAGYAIVDSNTDTLSVEFHRVRLDLETIAVAAHQSGMPHARWWISEWEEDE